MATIFSSQLKGTSIFICNTSISQYFTLLLLFLFSNSTSLFGQNLFVMKMGVGNGTIQTTTGAAINCNDICNANVTTGTALEFMASPAIGSRFVRWEGNFLGGTSISPRLTFVKVGGNTTVRALFESNVVIPMLSNAQITAEGIDAFLRANPTVNTMAKFLQALPDEYKQNWILMTRSESLQTGTAEFPRILLPSLDAKNVFTIGMVAHPSFPLSSPDAIEYMQWDETLKTFRFHEIVLKTIPPMGRLLGRIGPMVSIDDSKCFNCHSTNNVRNRSTQIGTTGLPSVQLPYEIVKWKAKPNWDTYDSWAGMLPFNRDRLYPSTLEDAVFRKILNLWNWRGSVQKDNVRSVLEQLAMQSIGTDVMLRNIDNINDNTHLQIAYTHTDGNRGVVDNKTTNHSFGSISNTSFSLTQGGSFFVLKNSAFPNPSGDEGRGIVLFDLLGGNKSPASARLNQRRVAHEIDSSQFATGSHPIDVRPIVYAILTGKIGYSTLSGSITTSFSGLPPGLSFVYPAAFFNARNALNISQMYDDVRRRQNSLPRRKADLQRTNIDRTYPTDATVDTRVRDPYLLNTDITTGGLYQYLNNTTSNPTLDYVRNEIFRRSLQSQVGADYRPNTDINGNVYVDREDVVPNTSMIALSRYFLEPLGVSVDKWSMGVRSRSATYAFSDIFSTYTTTISDTMRASLLRDYPRGTRRSLNVLNDADLLRAINETLGSLTYDVDEIPKFTDVQRIFNKMCIACHGGLDYPPYANTLGGVVNFSELEEDTPFDDLELPDVIPGASLSSSRRLWQSYYNAQSYLSFAYMRLLGPAGDEHAFPFQVMPAGGPRISDADRETIKRWILGVSGRPFTLGDPHLKTVDNVSYDFQAAGEFTLLRGDYFEIQTRQKATSSNGLFGPNPYTGLSSCVSINTAVAINVAGHRITYQPSTNNENKKIRSSSRLELRIDGKIIALNQLPYPFAPSSRIVKTDEEGAIRIEGVGGNIIAITPWFWSGGNEWGLMVDVIKTQANEGLIGNVTSGNWLPAMPDGRQLGAMPKDLAERFKILYNVFGEAWRVTDATSLFDYAVGTNTATFTDKNYPEAGQQQDCTIPGQQGGAIITRAEAEQLAAGIIDPERKELCIKDLMAIGEKNLVYAYEASDKAGRNRFPNIPILQFPKHGDEITATQVKFTWEKTGDLDGDKLTYKLYVWDAHELADDNKAIEIPDTSGFMGQGVWKCQLIILLLLLVLIIILYFVLYKEKRKWFYLLSLLLFILAFVLCKYWCKDKSTTVNYTVENLQHGKAYLWKVIADDGKGGITHSESRRVIIK